MMKMKNLLSIVLFYFSICISVYGQFVPYSLYTNSPVLTNAAYPGTHAFQEVWLNYRQSRIADTKAPALTYSHPLYSRSGRKFGGASATVINESWASGLFRMTGIETGFAYSVQFSSQHFLSMGMQAGLNMRGWDDSKITTSTQYVQGTFNPDFSNGEQMNTPKETLFSLHAGLLWYWYDQTGKPKGRLGLSTRNINRPEHKLFENGQTEAVTYIFSGSINVWEQGRMSIEPSFRFFHYKQSLANVGAMAHYQIKEELNTTLGLWYKTNKALSIMLQMNQGPFLVAVGFDMDAVQNLPEKNNNAFELSLGWRMKRNRKANRILSPAKPLTTPVPVFEEETTAQLNEPQPSEEENSPETVEPVVVQEEEPMTIVAEPELKFTAAEERTFAEPINFALGESRLTPEVETHINHLCELLKKYPHHTLTIVGHSCTLGGEETNSRIAMQRAEEVKLIFLKSGVDERRIKTISKGFHEPLVPNTTEAGRAKNRRVEIKLN